MSNLKKLHKHLIIIILIASLFFSPWRTSMIFEYIFFVFVAYPYEYITSYFIVFFLKLAKLTDANVSIQILHSYILL